MATPGWATPGWIVMWTLAASIYVACKGLTWVAWLTRHHARAGRVPRWKHAAYLLAWPGLDAAAFLTQPPTVIPTAREWTFAVTKSAAGVALFAAGAGGTLVSVDRHPYVAGWIGMIGVVLTLHFGLFHLLSCVWRRLGVEARPLMDHPLWSSSVSEFWSRRWNTAFRDVTHRFLFQPLRPWLGARGAIVGGFVFSGVVHDVVISLPARGGYGGPTLFFACQAAAMLVERSALGRRIGLGRGAAGRAFAAAALLAPLAVLFHPPFVERIVVPFMRALGTV